ncbi:TPA: N-acetyl-alpha-D-glucosaminyl L-malate synthase BshA [bacterium]|nr:N-acetyl-alpha-D-glucosaminyl L-malate synthase BshA [bacterium]
MRIGIVCYPTYGGSGVVATELAIELAKRHHDVHLICHHRPVRLDRSYSELTFHGVDVTPYSLFAYPFYTLSLASKIHQVAEDHNLEILHVHYAIPHTPAAFLARSMARKRNFKIITTLHGTDIHLVGLDPSYREVTRFSLRASDGITAVSSYLMVLTEREFGLEGSKRRVIYNFVDPFRFIRENQEDLRRLYSPNDEKVILHISNFREIKRIPDLINVFYRISLNIPSHLILIGCGPETTRVEDIAKDLGVSSKISLLGEVSDVVPFLAISDLFLLSSQMESFGLAALEAMSCGVPVVATRVGGLPEVIEDGISGYLVDPGDIKEMANCSLQILQDEDRWQSMASAGRRIACERFLLKEIISQYEEFYEEILKD